MIDISEPLGRAAASGIRWSRPEVRAALAAIAAESRLGQVDWDEDAGEAWGRVEAGGHISALVSAHMPLVVLTHGYGLIPVESLEAITVVVASFSAVELTATSEAVRSALPELAANLEDDPDLLHLDGFSAEELWFATV